MRQEQHPSPPQISAVQYIASCPMQWNQMLYQECGNEVNKNTGISSTVNGEDTRVTGNVWISTYRANSAMLLSSLEFVSMQHMQKFMS